MRVAVLSEDAGTETRVAATPDTVKRYRALGADVVIQAGAGVSAGIPDAEFEAAGATIAPTSGDAARDADIVLRVRRPEASELKDLKPGALVVNAARGGVLDEDALARALVSGHVGGAALDVFRVEPLPDASPLRTAPRVLLSPHAAGSTVQAVTRILEQTNANLRRVLDGEPVVDVVNGLAPSVVRRRARA